MMATHDHDRSADRIVDSTMLNSQTTGLAIDTLPANSSLIQLFSHSTLLSLKM